MLRGHTIASPEELRNLALGSAAHVLLVSSLFVGLVFMVSAIGRGLSATAERLSMTSQRMFVRFGPALDRLDRLMQEPDDFGFPLYVRPVAPVAVPTRVVDDGDPNPDRIPTARPTTDPEAPTARAGDDGQVEAHRDLISFAARQATLDEAVRTAILDKARPLRFDSYRACLLLKTVRDLGGGVEALEGERQAFFRDFFRLPPRNLGLDFSDEQLDHLTSRYTFEYLCRKTDEKQGIYALRSLLPGREAGTAATATTTATPTATTAPTATPTQVAASLNEEDYRRLERGEMLYTACVGRQAEVAKAFERYRTASLAAVTSLDLRALRDAGFLSSPASCPEGGTYSLDNAGRVTCSIHGNEADPAEAHTQYMAAFQRFNIAKEAYLLGRYNEALFHAQQIVKEQPRNFGALELLALSQMKLSQWAEAAINFEKTSKMVRDDARLLFDTGYCFYAAGNKTLAAEYLTKVGEATWAGSQRSYTRARDFYLTLDRARWMRPMVDRMRYLDFRLQREPEFPSALCETRLRALRDRLNALTDEYYETPHVKTLTEHLVSLSEKLGGLRDFEVDDRKAVQDEIRETKAKLATRIQTTGAGSLVAHLDYRLLGEGAERTDFCPTGERYFVDALGQMDCAQHRHMLADGGVSPRLRLTPETTAALNDVLVRAAAAANPELQACFEKQRALVGILGEGAGTERLTEKRASGAVPSGADVCPSSGKAYEFKPFRDRPSASFLTCPDHKSWQLFRVLPQE